MNEIKEYRLYSCDSTISFARNRIKKSGIFLITAGIQKQGKGSMQKKWFSYHGNFLSTLFLSFNKNQWPKSENYGFNFFKSFSFDVYRAIKISLPCYLRGCIRLKEPNDILLKNKKICGLRFDCCTLGKNRAYLLSCGVNINHHPSVRGTRMYGASSIRVHYDSYDYFYRNFYFFFKRFCSRYVQFMNCSPIRRNNFSSFKEFSPL